MFLSWTAFRIFSSKIDRLSFLLSKILPSLLQLELFSNALQPVVKVLCTYTDEDQPSVLREVVLRCWKQTFGYWVIRIAFHILGSCKFPLETVRSGSGRRGVWIVWPRISKSLDVDIFFKINFSWWCLGSAGWGPAKGGILTETCVVCVDFS